LIEHGAKSDIADNVRNWWLDDIRWINKIFRNGRWWDDMIYDMIDDEMTWYMTW